MVKVFVWFVFMSYVVCADIHYTPSVFGSINQYDEDVIIVSKKLQKYKNCIKKSMVNMRRNIGVRTGEPYLFTFEISQTDTKDNVLQSNIVLALGRYRTTKDKRAFFQNIYTDSRQVSLNIEDESVMKVQLMKSINDMLNSFKMKYIDDII